MKYFTYVLYSKTWQKTYVGITGDLERRLKQHNSGYCCYTRRYKPWNLLFSERFDSRAEARIREKYFKSSAGRKNIRKTMFNGRVAKLADAQS